MLPELKAFPKTTVMPKKANSAFLEFTIHSHEQVKNKFPNLTLVDMMRKKAELWNIMSEIDKKPYLNLAAIDHKRFEDEVLQLKSNGFFINKDGVKSSDKKKKVKVEETKAPKEKTTTDAKKTAKENEASIKEKALVMAKLDKPVKSGFEIFKLLKFRLHSKKIHESGAKE